LVEAAYSVIGMKVEITDEIWKAKRITNRRKAITGAFRIKNPSKINE
jgi:hypothetical protein